MSKENGKEESKFGFKDKSKALETLKHLESEDMSYQRLTVRGLLGRAKRVLSMTKAEDKIKNIKEAMKVFEDWTEANTKDGGKKTVKNDKSERKSSDSSGHGDVDMKDLSKEKSDKVPGLGFKDEEAARQTLKNLEGRDPDYQKLAVKGLLGSAKRVLSSTKDKTKLGNIKTAMKILEDFLDYFDRNGLAKQNCPYLSLDLVEACHKMIGDSSDYKIQLQFIKSYKEVGGDYKKLRTCQHGDSTWDIVRNRHLKELKDKYKDAKLFDESGKPSKEHLSMILWAYSPDDYKLKRTVDTSRTSNNKRKSHTSDDDCSPSKKKKE